MPQLSTVQKLKIHLDIDVNDQSEDTRLEQLLEQVEEAIYGWTGRDSFVSQQFIEYHDGNGRSMLALDRRPATAITDLRVDANGYYGSGDNAFPESTVWQSGKDFALKRADESERNGGLVIALRHAWPEGRGNIKVAYTAGYTEIPRDLQLATHMLCAATRNAAETGAIKAQERLGDYSYQLLVGSTQAPAGVDVIEARSLLGRYKELAR
jgi:hypothetical protein